MGDVFADKACAFIATNKDKPFFLYYASHENHVPRVHHPRYAGRTPLGPRGDAVVAFDDQAGRILAELDKHGLAENTLVIYTSDNGPVLDDGYKDQAVERNQAAGHRPAGPFRGGKYSILEGGTRVGFIARWPGRAGRQGLRSPDVAGRPAGGVHEGGGWRSGRVPPARRGRHRRCFDRWPGPRDDHLQHAGQHPFDPR